MKVLVTLIAVTFGLIIIALMVFAMAYSGFKDERDQLQQRFTMWTECRNVAQTENDLDSCDRMFGPEVDR